MRLLQYKNLDLARVRPAFDRVKQAIESGDFRTADVKKLHAGVYYRAKLGYADRLLMRFASVGGEIVCLALEVIENHAYERSRFLRGAPVEEARIEREPAADATAIPAADDVPLRWLHPSRARFELLDKPIVFDDAQEAVAQLPAPVVIVGSAGSGKTAVTLSKLRDAEGRVLYVTLSAYLAQSALALYGAHGYDNPAQEVDFFSYREFLETLKVPPGREVHLPAFSAWFDRHRAAARELGDVDAHALFEEFRGVIGAPPGGPLSLPDYLALGVRQSLLPPASRPAAHGLFGRYRQWLGEARMFDLNLVAHDWLALAGPVYDFVVVDEVQDLTPVQLALLLASLRKPGQFLLCGDSNQIVHPNFFSWAAVRSLFWQGLGGEQAQRQALQVLQANYRNTRRVTELANRLLKIKQARFGSVDRESNFLVASTATDEGQVTLLAAKDPALAALDAASRASVQHAVIVLRDEDKVEARAKLRTPLLFSVHEAKGLEYPHVLLYNLVSGQRRAYADVTDGVGAADLDGDALDYRRARDKGDKSLETYKFYVNALYVAMTRAVQTLTFVEADPAHPLLALLGLRLGEARAAPVRTTSSKEEWAQEARRLELQGKEEQARAIRPTFLQARPVPWTPWSQALVEELAAKAFDAVHPGNKPRQAILDYALWHGQQRWIERLAEAGFAQARGMLLDGEFLHVGSIAHAQTSVSRLYAQQQQNLRTLRALRQRHLQASAAHNFKDILRQCDAHGADHVTPVGATSLMLAARAGNPALVDALLQRGADPARVDEFGQTAWLQAVSRAMEEPVFASGALAVLFDRLAPAVLDVQVESRLVRLERHQGEYWVLTLMLAGLKTQWSFCAARGEPPFKYAQGFFAEHLHRVLAALPPHLWPERRRKRSYVNQVLARAELSSAYQPARRLWARAGHGHYLPNPALQLRRGDGWLPVYDALNLPWIDAGSGGARSYRAQPAGVVGRLARSAQELAGADTGQGA